MHPRILLPITSVHMDLRGKEIHSRGTLKKPEAKQAPILRLQLQSSRLRKGGQKTEDRKRMVVQCRDEQTLLRYHRQHSCVGRSYCIQLLQTLANGWIYCIVLFAEVCLCTTRYHPLNSTPSQLTHTHLVHALNVLWCPACCPRASRLKPGGHLVQRILTLLTCPSNNFWFFQKK